MSSNIKVCVRLRPLDEAKKERWAGGFGIHGRRVSLGPKSYDPDVTLPPESSQEETFQHCVPILDAVKEGNNGTIMVYGQTGTGKTHTMIGAPGAYSGVSMRAVGNLLDHVRERSMAGARMALTLSVLEIYNEKITDMLCPGGKEVLLIGGFPRQVESRALTNMPEAEQMVKRALDCRHVSATAMNDRSSRSHVILMLDLQEELGDRINVAKLFLIDLAGSESIKKSQAAGRAAAEAGMINKSLLALKNVILTLSTSSESSRPHVPYRDSKLTELLQDSIGGTARTMFIACISPNGRDVEETKSTLEYATKARNIRNVSNSERDRLQIKVRGLEVEVQRLRNRLQDKLAERGSYQVSREEHEENLARVDALAAAQEQVSQLLEDRRQGEAKHSLVLGHVALVEQRALEAEQREVAQKAEFARALAEFQQTTASIEDIVKARLEGIGLQCERQLQAAHEKMRACATVLKSDEAVGPSIEQLRFMWRDANAQHREGMLAVVQHVAEYATKVRDVQERRQSQVNEVLTMLHGTVGEHITKAQAVLSAERDDIAQESDLAVGLCRDRAAKTTLGQDRSESVLVAFAASASDEVADSVPCVDLDAVANAVNECRGAVHAAVKGTMANGLETAGCAAVEDLPPEAFAPPPVAPSRLSVMSQASNARRIDSQGVPIPAAPPGMPMGPGRRGTRASSLSGSTRSSAAPSAAAQRVLAAGRENQLPSSAKRTRSVPAGLSEEEARRRPLR